MKRSNDGITKTEQPNKLARANTHERVVLRYQKTSPPTSNFVTPLLTDMYQISMCYSYWKNRKHLEPATFELFFRENPFKGEFTIFAGLEEVIRHVSNFGFSDAEIQFLRTSLPKCDSEFFDWLKTVDCSQIRILSVSEGTIVFPRTPLIRVEGPIAVAQLLETTLLTLVNYPSLIATNAARHRLAAGPNKTLLEFGLRRAQGVDGGVSASRYSYLGGFDGTSNVLAGMLFGIPAKGTQAHSYITSFVDINDIYERTLKDAQGKQSYDFVNLVLECRTELGFTRTNDSELISFTSYAISFPENFLALVDTYDTLKSGIPNFITVSYALHKLGFKGIGIRLDSGDLAYLSIEARKMFKEFAEKTKIEYFQKFSIVASSDLDEELIISLNQQGHSIDVFGVGTHLVTCKAQPALGCVYKLVETRSLPRIKISQDVAKVTIPGSKDIYRLYGEKSYPIDDIMMRSGQPAPKVGERLLSLHPFNEKKRAYIRPSKVISLLRLYWDYGNVVETLPSLDEIRKYVLEQLTNMRPDHLRATVPTEYKVSVSHDLYDLIHNLWLTEVPIAEINS